MYWVLHMINFVFLTSTQNKVISIFCYKRAPGYPIILLTGQKPSLKWTEHWLLYQTPDTMTCRYQSCILSQFKVYVKGVFMYYVETYNVMNLPYQLKTKAKVTNLKIPGIFSKKYRVYYILNTPHPTTTTTHLDFSWNSPQWQYNEHEK